MSEPDDKRELSGLARSIDALFTGAVGRDSVSADSDTLSPEPLPSSAFEVAETGDAEAALELDAAPADEPLPDPFGIWHEPVGEDAHASVQSPSFPQDEAPTDALAEEAVGEADLGVVPGDVVEEATEPPLVAWELAEPGAGNEPSASPDPGAFARAVDAFVEGAPDAADEVEELAVGLREKLALDPLADAVERLVREAGDPPSQPFIDLASSVINPAVASRIVQRIGHTRDETRRAEYTVLCQRLGVIMAKAFRGALTGATDPAARRSYYDMLVAMGDTSRPIIEEMVYDENTLLVRSGVALLGEMGGERALEFVTSGLAHPDARVRREALLSLGKLGDEDSGALVVGLLEDTEPDVRVAAATAAGELKVDRALRPMLALLEAEGDADGALALIDALGELGDPGAVPAIEKHAVKTLFSKPRTELRVAAYRALHRIGTPHARDLVQQALSDKEPGIRAAVRGIVGAGAER